MVGAGRGKPQTPVAVACSFVRRRRRRHRQQTRQGVCGCDFRRGPVETTPPPITCAQPLPSLIELARSSTTGVARLPRSELQQIQIQIAGAGRRRKPCLSIHSVCPVPSPHHGRCNQPPLVSYRNHPEPCDYAIRFSLPNRHASHAS